MFPLLVLAFALVVSADPSVVQFPAGAAEGILTASSRSFLGLPFAAPPVNELRWKAPQPLQPWTGVRNATYFRDACMQQNSTDVSNVNISEDCLYLNIYAPIPVPSKPVPVMLFFYGGSWDQGAASDPRFFGVPDVSLVENTIIVTANYRVNLFGWLASDALRGLDPEGSTGNYGLQDQRAAMRWVAANIAAVGGDPSKVTIFGESAGSGSVSVHLVSPKSEGLFAGVIAESGPFVYWVSQNMTVATEKYIQIATMVGCCNGSPCSGNDITVLTCLQSTSGEALLAVADKVKGFSLIYSPVIDGVELTADPRELAAKGLAANVPVIFGSNADEGTYFNPCPVNTPTDEYVNYLVTNYGADLGNAVAVEYPISDFSSVYWATSRAIGDRGFSCPVRSSARWIAEGRVGKPSPAPVYEYFFNHTLAITKRDYPNLGCYHGSELYLVFDNKPFLDPSEQTLAAAFVDYWTSFAATGVPTSPGNPTWLPFTVDDQVVNTLDVNTIVTPTYNLKQSQCDFWLKWPMLDVDKEIMMW